MPPFPRHQWDFLRVTQRCRKVIMKSLFQWDYWFLAVQHTTLPLRFKISTMKTEEYGHVQHDRSDSIRTAPLVSRAPGMIPGVKHVWINCPKGSKTESTKSSYAGKKKTEILKPKMADEIGWNFRFMFMNKHVQEHNPFNTSRLLLCPKIGNSLRIKLGNEKNAIAK